MVKEQQASPLRWCDWHSGTTATEVVACWGATNSGPSVSVPTCESCRAKYNPKPVKETR